MYKHILHATDLSENHYQICEKTVHLAKALQADLQFLHVIEIPASLQWAQSLGFTELAHPVKDDAQAVMSTLGDAFLLPKHHLHVEIGSAYLIILEKMKQWNCDLLILGSHKANALPSFLGSTARAIAHHATCDIITMQN